MKTPHRDNGGVSYLFNFLKTPQCKNKILPLVITIIFEGCPLENYLPLLRRLFISA